MVIKVYNCLVFGRSAEDLKYFAKTAKVLLDNVLLVEACGHVPALDGGAVRG